MLSDSHTRLRTAVSFQMWPFCLVRSSVIDLFGDRTKQASDGGSAGMRRIMVLVGSSDGGEGLGGGGGRGGGGSVRQSR